MKKIIVEILGTIIGSAVMAIGIALFLLPNQLSSGGVSGLATICYYVLNIPMGIVILSINIPLFLIAIWKLGKDFFIKSIIGTVSLSVFIDLLDKVKPLTHDIFLACIYGGILTGLGSAIILKSHSSTGGSEMISNILKKFKPNIRMSYVIMIFDIIVVTLNIIFLKKLEIGLYSAIAIYIMGKIKLKSFWGQIKLKIITKIFN